MHAKSLARECSRLLFLLSALVLLIPAAHAHEFWIEPSSFRPAAGAAFDVHLRVGQEFRGDAMIYLPESFERFVTINVRGQKNVEGVPGDDPAARLTITDPGLLLIAYQSTRYSVDMDAATFKQYLAKEGLEHLVPAQRSNDKSVREVYRRCAKSLLAVGGRSESFDFKKPLGLRLEILPLTSPYSLKKDQILEIQLLYENRPLTGAQIMAMSKTKPKSQLLQRTDRAGRARFVLPHADVWLLNAVHMIPAPADAKADWESFWASLSFETSIKP